MAQVYVTYRYGSERHRSSTHRAGSAAYLRNCLGAEIHVELDWFHTAAAFMRDAQLEVAGHEAMAISVDKIARHVLAQRDGRWSREIEIRAAPTRDLCGRPNRAGFETVTWKKSFTCQHAIRVCFVSAFLAPGLRQQPFVTLHERVAAAE